MQEKFNEMLEEASSLGIKAYLLDAEDIAVENRIALKCAYGCKSYGKRLSCPPHILSIDEFRKILREYSKALLLVEEYDTSGTDDVLKAWGGLRKAAFRKMYKLEQEAFRKGFIYAQLLRPGSCNECETCHLEGCIKPELRRFAPEAVGINLGKVMEAAGMELEFCKPDRTMCVGILLLE